MKVLIAIDVGGSFYKGSIVPKEDISAHIIEAVQANFKKQPVKIGNMTEVDSLYTFIRDLYKDSMTKGCEIIGLGMGWPGPFDLKDGIAWMDHKLRDFKGINLRQGIKEHILEVAKIPVYFFYDVHAFGAAEYRYGEASLPDRFIGITLGTGLGSCFIDRGVIVQTARDDIPVLGSLWDSPYLGGIVEDYVSSRYVLSGYYEKGGKKKDTTVAQIIDDALEGDNAASQVFREMGFHLGSSLRKIIKNFKPEKIVIGGGLSVAYNVFEQDLRRGACLSTDDKRLVKSLLNYYSSLLGIQALMRKEIVYE
jgi:glucokinase